ncbi:ABC transporter ATP-binding protein [Micromonospora sp. WMMD708]|uniref:ABC transporter ATP-binding protein n=1 Tax=Micromonospora sp. WMMD708 TaxID=3403464 RepID=UPI003BF56BD2
MAVGVSSEALILAVRARLRIARLAVRAGPAVVGAAVLVNTVLGVLPVVFIVASSRMLGALPQAVADGSGSPAWPRVVEHFLVACAALAAQQVVAGLQNLIAEEVARRIDGQVFDRLIVASLRTPELTPLEDPELLDQLSTAVRELEAGVHSPGWACAGLLNLIARYVQLIGCAAAIGVAFAWPAAVAALAAMLLLRHGQRGGLRRYSQIWSYVAATRRRADYYRNLAVSGPAAKEIRIFGLLDWLSERYRTTYLAVLRRVWAERRRIYLRPFWWYAGFALAGMAAVLAAVGHAAGRTLPLTELALVVQAALAALRLGDFYPESDVQTQFGMNAYDAVRRFERAVARFGPPPQPAAAPPRPAAAPPSATAPPTVRFENVSFRYPGQPRPVFERLNLTLGGGRCTALVGVNGAGKTTLVKLLARLYTPDEGRITVDGRDIRDLDLDTWRSRFGMVFQDFNRYEATAADNIALGAVGHLDDRPGIRRAAARAGILPLLENLPRGLDTPLARQLTDGVDLSGGQWQRIAIARALFALDKGAAILVLDEPTASLDVRAEARFFDEFVGLTRGVTSLLISHRFSTVRHADRIVVLADGVVVEEGSHEELLAAGDRYATLFRLQAQRFVDDGPPPERPPAVDGPAAEEPVAGPVRPGGPVVAGRDHEVHG